MGKKATTKKQDQTSARARAAAIRKLALSFDIADFRQAREFFLAGQDADVDEQWRAAFQAATPTVKVVAADPSVADRINQLSALSLENQAPVTCVLEAGMFATPESAAIAEEVYQSESSHITRSRKMLNLCTLSTLLSTATQTPSSAVAFEEILRQSERPPLRETTTVPKGVADEPVIAEAAEVFSAIPCDFCGKKLCVEYRIQIRAADEPESIGVECTGCGKRKVT